MTKKIYNYVVVFKGQMSEGVGKFMTETMARNHLINILKNARLDDITFSVKRLTPQITFDMGTTITGETNNFTLTGGAATTNTFTLDQ